jgi:phytoene dehydrogenase-like protein
MMLRKALKYSPARGTMR